MAETDTKAPSGTQAPAAPNPEQKPVPNAATPKKGGSQPKGGESAAMVGIVGEKMEKLDRALPQGEPPLWPPNEQLKVVGKRTLRLDGRAKVTGAAKYTADVKLPGMLYGRLITSPHPHAIIKSIDTSAAEKHPRVKGVHLLEGGKKEDGGTKYPKLRYVGQPIGAVAAVTQADADEAARLIKIEYQILPFVVDMDKAKEKDAPVIFEAPVSARGSAGGGGGPRDAKQEGNVRKSGPRNTGNIEQGFSEAQVVHEATYITQVQTHSALETHGLVCDYKPEQVTVYASTQGTDSVREEIATIFNLQRSQVRVLTEYMGGGFGAKFGAGNYGVLAAHLSKKAGAPVRMMLDRREEHLSVGNRPNSHQQLKIGAKKDGTLTALQLTSYGTAGVGTGAGASGPHNSLYNCPNRQTEDADIFTNAGPSAAFRAPGHPQGAFSLEVAMDELADKLGMDPLEFRDKNDPSDARRVERKIGAEKIGWKDRKPAGSDSGPIKRGIGVGQSIWGRFMNKDAHCEVRLTRDGSVELLSSVQDIGSGIRTALAQIVAEELGLKPTDIAVKIGDTNYPHGPASGGSVTTNSITPAARNAAWKVRQQLLQQVAPELGAKPEELTLADAKVSVTSDPSKSLTFKQACRKLKTDQIIEKGDRSDDYDSTPGQRRRRGPTDSVGGVQFVQVAVDTETGEVKVERVVAVHDSGRPINPLCLESQINGGVIQGLSYALYENRILDRQTGIMVNPNLEQYKIMGAKDCPQIEPIIIEQLWGKSSTDAGPIGEPATVPTAAAIANAVYNAIGVRIRQIPITPAVVLNALAQQTKGASA